MVVVAVVARIVVVDVVIVLFVLVVVGVAVVVVVVVAEVVVVVVCSRRGIRGGSHRCRRSTSVPEFVSETARMCCYMSQVASHVSFCARSVRSATLMSRLSSFVACAWSVCATLGR